MKKTDIFRSFSPPKTVFIAPVFKGLSSKRFESSCKGLVLSLFKDALSATQATLRRTAQEFWIMRWKTVYVKYYNLLYYNIPGYTRIGWEGGNGSVRPLGLKSNPTTWIRNRPARRLVTQGSFNHISHLHEHDTLLNMDQEVKPVYLDGVWICISLVRGPWVVYWKHVGFRSPLYTGGKSLYTEFIRAEVVISVRLGQTSRSQDNT